MVNFSATSMSTWPYEHLSAGKRLHTATNQEIEMYRSGTRFKLYPVSYVIQLVPNIAYNFKLTGSVKT